MLVIAAIVVITAAVSISKPEAVKAVGRGIVCAVTFGHAKCKAPTPAVAPISAASVRGDK